MQRDSYPSYFSLSNLPKPNSTMSGLVDSLNYSKKFDFVDSDDEV